VDVTLHLIRHREPPPGVVAAGDPVLYERDGAWVDPTGAPLTDEQLVTAIFRAARVVVW